MRSVAAAVLCALLCAAAGPGAPALRRFDTPYYVVHTDLPQEGAAEAVVRMTRLGDELRQRTRELGFNGRIEQRLPFFLYARHADFLAATGEPQTSAGVFLGDRLVAAATDARGSAAWHVVQHESFHQFAAATTGTELPAWLNEGLGEYFGEALFTGDGYTTGVVPAWRLKRVRRSIEGDRFAPLAGFAHASQDEWNRDMTLDHYDQAWSLVQFLLHGDAGKHHGLVVRYVRLLGAGKAARVAWNEAFGGLPNLEKDWKRYWQSLPDEGTPDVYSEAAVATITSFYARAWATGQSFESFKAFTRAARAGTLRAGRPQDWLPPSLLLHALDSLPKEARCTIQGEGEMSAIVAQFPGGRLWVGAFSLRDGRVAGVNVIEGRLADPDPGTLKPDPDP